MNPYQGTVARSLEFAGVGLHSGKNIHLKVSPGAPGTGIVFFRTDVPNPDPIQANVSNISATTLCTTVGSGSNAVSTIEHLMAAFVGLGVDNAIVEVSANEIPILDGSAASFVDKLNAVGIQRQSLKRKYYKTSKPLEVRCFDQYMKWEPHPEHEDYNHLIINCSINFSASQVIGKQSLVFTLNEKSFMDICEARTFCHMKDVQGMREKGLALGGSLDNAIVVDNHKVLNNEGLRYPDEFVRHKILDCLGDLALLGGGLVGKLTLYKAGHSLHASFMRELLKQRLGDHSENKPTRASKLFSPKVAIASR